MNLRAALLISILTLQLIYFKSDSIARNTPNKVTVKNEKIQQRVKAIEYSLESVSAACYTFRAVLPGQVPPLYEVSDRLALLKALIEQANILTQQPNATWQDRTIAHEMIKHAVQLVDSFIYVYTDDWANEEFQENVLRLYKIGTNNAWVLYQKDSSLNKIEELFFFIEKSKVFQIQQLIVEKRTIHDRNIHDSIFEAYHPLSNLALQAEIQLKEAVRTNKTDVLDSLTELWYLHSKTYLEFVLKFQNKNSMFWEQVLNTKPATIESLQQHLDNETIFFSTFLSENAVYVLAITKNHVIVKQLSNTKKIESNIRAYQESLSLDFQFSSPKMIEQYKRNAHELYKLVLQPFLLKEGRCNRLIFSFGQLLGQINPNALLITEPLVGQKMSEWSYLIKKYAVSFAYSAGISMLHSSPRRRQLLKTFAGFAPSYEPQGKLPIPEIEADKDWLIRNGQMPLPGARQEVIQSQSLLGGDIWVDQSANINNFKMVVDNYEILHLAMHGLYDMESNHNSGLFFSSTEDSSRVELLTISDIYVLPIEARLVVLSACQSGMGVYREGEGIISLARAFYYAGCPTVAMSSWNLSDASAAELSRYFYEALLEGRPVDHAMREAQLTFLSNTDLPERQHPYYWATMLIIGDPSPIYIKNRTYQPNILLGIFVFFCVLCVLYIIRRLK